MEKRPGSDNCLHRYPVDAKNGATGAKSIIWQNAICCCQIPFASSKEEIEVYLLLPNFNKLLRCWKECA